MTRRIIQLELCANLALSGAEKTTQVVNLPVGVPMGGPPNPLFSCMVGSRNPDGTGSPRQEPCKYGRFQAVSVYNTALHTSSFDPTV